MNQHNFVHQGVKKTIKINIPNIYKLRRNYLKTVRKTAFFELVKMEDTRDLYIFRDLKHNKEIELTKMEVEDYELCMCTFWEYNIEGDKIFKNKKHVK
jgi:hypothetical protein